MDFNIKFTAKRNFFDKEVVIRRLGEKNARAMRQFGGFIRTTAGRSMRRRKGSSEPGNPPNTHSRDKIATLRQILYAFNDSAKSSMVVGPVRLNQVNMTATGSKPVPQIMEQGGTVQIREEQYINSKNGKWYRRDLRRNARPEKRYRVRPAKYAPRPFMGPALEKSAPRFPQLYQAAGLAAA